MRKLFTLLALTAALSPAVSAQTSVTAAESYPGIKMMMSDRPLRNSAPLRSPAKAAPEGAKEIPFSETLGKATSSNPYSFTTIDANGDGRGWNTTTHSGSYSACMGPNTDALQLADDWLVTPPLHLLAGKEYEMSVSLCGSSTATKTADFAIYMGSEPTAAALTTELVAKKTYQGKTYAVVTKTLQVEADGYYYIGIHCTTDKAVNTISRAKDFSIAEHKAPVDAPAAGTITYSVAEPLTDMKVEVSYTAPTTAQSGAALTAISKVEIVNWVYPDRKHIIDNPEPGKTYKATLDLLVGPNNRICATAYVDDTAGTMAETKSFYAGPDTPERPTGIKATLSDDYRSVTLTWDPVPAVGENGGYVDPAAVKYYVFDAFGSYTDPAIIEDAKSPCVIEIESADRIQDFLAYQVTAGNDVGYSLEGESNVVVSGPADTLPWHESFSQCYYGQAWMQDLMGRGNVNTGLWYDNELQTNTDAPDGTEPEYMHPHDLDDGFMLLLPYAKDDCFGINSVKIDISAAAHPVFEFFYQGQGSRLEALVAREDGDMTTAETIDLRQSPTTGWTRCRVDLTPYKDARYVRVGVRMTAIHNDDSHTWSVPLDNLRVIDLADVDFRIALATLENPVAGKENKVYFSIENMGTAAGGDATVSLCDGDRVLASAAMPAVGAGEVRAATTAFTPSVLDTEPYEMYIRISAEADRNTANNTAGPQSVEVEQSRLPAPEAPAADKPGDNLVALTWAEPDYSPMTETPTVTEGFDSPDMPAFAAVTWGEWRFDDLDGLAPYKLFDDTANPYKGMRIGFQVYDYKKAGIPEEQYADAMPHSGDRMLIAPSGQGRNSNWIISPRLCGEAQTIRFWAKSFTVAFPESFTVRYSTGDNKTSSFTHTVEVGGYPADGTIPEVWTEYTADLPAGAEYFAIEHDSNDSWGLFVDDITYTAAAAYPADLALTGYNVWRDGDLLQHATAAAHTDAPGADGTYSYRVSACYNYGESAAAAPVTTDFTYDSLADATACAATVTAADGYITVDGAAGRSVAIVTADGRTLYSGIAATQLRVPAAPGIYLVRIDSTATKAILRR